MGVPGGVTPRRRLGQSFLIDTDVMRRMVREAGLTRSHTVLEVGPGPGTLTRVLAAKANRVHALEIDRQFRDALAGVTDEYPNVHIRWGDARSTRLPPFDVVVSSLPYSASLPILFRLLEHGFERGAVLLQDRQARRLAAQPGERGYSRIGVMAQRLATVDLVARVERDCFVPAPRVDSALVRVQPREDASERAADRVEFGHIVDALFVHRAATLESAMQASGMGEAVGDIPRRLRTTRVEALWPDGFAVVVDAVGQRGLAVAPTPKSVKRRAN